MSSGLKVFILSPKPQLNRRVEAYCRAYGLFVPGICHIEECSLGLENRFSENEAPFAGGAYQSLDPHGADDG